MMTDQEFEDLKELLRAEKRRQRANHWTYELARHTNLYNRYLAERTRRDIEAIDAAFVRAIERMEAAE